jgi:hypothetical protein
MSKKVLTKKIIEQFIADEDSVDLSRFTKMDKGGYTAVVEHLLPRIQFPYDVVDGISVDEKLLTELRSKLIENLPDEFIVKHRHYHCEMEIEGYEIMNPEYFKKLQEALKSEESVCLPNSPGHWDSELPISDLTNAFQIISVSQDDVDAFRKLYQKNSIGITELSVFLVQDEVDDDEWSSIDEESEEGQDLLLTEDIAQDIVDEYSQVGYSYSHEVSSFSIIENKAMEILAKGVDYIPLSGLKQISDEVAEVLATTRTSLDLGKLKEIPLSVAQIFVSKNSKLTEIQLDSVKTISPEVAECLSKLKDNVSLKGIVDFPDANGGELLAKKLAKMIGAFYSISFPNLKKINLEILNLLLKNNGGVELGIEELTPEIATALSTYKGNKKSGRNKISLCRVSSLQENALDELLKFKGDLHLDNITELSESVAGKLSKFNGGISLSGLYKIDSKIAGFLGSHPGDFLSIGLSELKDPLVAQELAKYKGCLDLPEIQSISDEAAEALSKFKGKMFKSMSPFEISKVGAKSLSMIEDKLSLNFVPKEKIKKALYG